MKNISRYYIDGFDMVITNDAMLPQFQKDNPMYDRFDPWLAKIADNKGSWIIDIGANIGDTVAGLIRHTKANVVCVEPDDKYFKLLKRNIKAFPEEYRNRIWIDNCFIGDYSKDAGRYISERIKGTAHMVVNDNGNHVIGIIDLMDKYKIPSEDLGLVKIDTDGHDPECIFSFGDQLTRIRPILFWENLIRNKEEREKADDLAIWLFDKGYNSFFIFDNFGNYMAYGDYKLLMYINDYALRIRQGYGRGIYYTDILACKKEDEEMIKTIVNEYLGNFICH